MSALPVAILGGILGLDMVSFPQIMIARPIVSATVAGAMAGRPEAGLLIGVVLELIALETLPFGASRYAEWGSAGAVGGAVYASQEAGMPAGLPLGMLAALVAAVASSWSMVVLRKLNVRTVRAFRPIVDQGSVDAVTTVQLRGLAFDFLRASLITLVALLVFIPLSHTIVASWSTDLVLSRAVVVSVAATVAASAVWGIFHSAARAGWLFLVGLVVGGLLLTLQ
jgi:mannose/fructose/N-acetylgalactosamine-specific phosphotransferase system component IIC